MGGTTDMPTGDLSRRSVIKRAAVVGAATAWATPTIQSIASPAFAAGSPVGRCTACITGGGNVILGGTFNGQPLTQITVGLGQICCEPNGAPANQQEVSVTLHPNQGNSGATHFMFRHELTITCTKTEPNPAPPPGTEECANVFTGTLKDADGNTLSFVFEDHGEPGQNVDKVSVSISGPAGTASGSGTLARGNLQVHDGLGPIERDCSGC